jgi:hypothetical protein
MGCAPSKPGGAAVSPLPLPAKRQGSKEKAGGNSEGSLFMKRSDPASLPHLNREEENTRQERVPAADGLITAALEEDNVKEVPNTGIKESTTQRGNMPPEMNIITAPVHEEYTTAQRMAPESASSPSYVSASSFLNTRTFPANAHALLALVHQTYHPDRKRTAAAELDDDLGMGEEHDDESSKYPTNIPDESAFISSIVDEATVSAELLDELERDLEERFSEPPGASSFLLP